MMMHANSGQTENARPAVDLEAIRDHLTSVYGAADGGFLPIWQSATKLTQWVPVDDLDTAAATIARIGQTGNVYCGVGLHPVDRGPEQRGSADGVSALPGLYAEIDIGSDGHADGNRPPDVPAVAELVRAAVAALPSYVVHSGGGLHLYWLFHEPWQLEGPDDRRRAARMNKALQWLLIREARKRGWTVDNTSDLARVLRPAGTVNRKPGLPERPVRALRDTGRRYAIDELEHVLPLEDHLFDDRPERVRDGRPPRKAAASWARIVAECGFMRHCQDDAARLSEPEWHAQMTVVARCVDGPALAHKLSAPYPEYDPVETTRKHDIAAERDNPIRCQTVRDERGGEPWCARCPHWGRIASPIVLGYPRGYAFARPAQRGQGTGND